MIRVTGEVFTDYESYLARYVHPRVEQAQVRRLTRLQAGVPSTGKCSRQAYRAASADHEQKKFTDSVNGKSGLTFEAALASEVRSLVNSSMTSDANHVFRTKARPISSTSFPMYFAKRCFGGCSSRQSHAWMSLVQSLVNPPKAACANKYKSTGSTKSSSENSFLAKPSSSPSMARSSKVTSGRRPSFP